MRRNLFALLVAVVVPGPIVSVAEAEVVVEKQRVAFPLPADAVAQRETSKQKKVADTRIAIYDVPRGRDAVVTEVRAALDAGNWVVVKNVVSKSSVRLILRKEGRTWKASFTGDDKRAVIIVTAP
jgi:hypothetical protein